ncbi:hypothetical protein D3C77_192610 [compost metagenome]|uniref:hypothetical protein n=1 Tax=Pseudomonas sp. JUb96 TaxID=2940539 RepID=UPI000FBD0A46|nr:hypothetical protein [Pseudomonas sp. JUb96]MCW2270734.1 hypothetical protein [Pseudomonas sp. JUb96]
MSEHSQEDLESSLVKLDEKLPALVSIQNMFWNSTTQFKALLTENGVPDGVKATSSARRYTVNTMTYIRLIYIYGDNPEKLAKDLTVVIKTSAGNTYHATIMSNKTYAYIWVKSFCDWFEVSSTTRLLKPQIKRIEIHGASQDQLVNHSKDIEDTIELKRIIEKFKSESSTEFEEIQKEIAEKNLEGVTLDAELKEKKNLIEFTQGEYDALSELRSKVQAKLTSAELELKLIENKLVDAKNNADQLSQKTETFNKNIADLNAQLQKLTNDRNLISDEYGPYVKEGNSQAVIYSMLVTLPLAAIIFSIYQVYIGASKLLTAEYSSATDVLAAFILRIPFAAIFGLAIFYSWKLANSMIQKIFKIHGDRLTLAKLLVVARETVHSSAKNLGITDHEKFQEQTALKIEVLKSHMARDLNEDFTYKPIPSQKSSTKGSSSETSGEAVNDDLVEIEKATKAP